MVRDIYLYGIAGITFGRHFRLDVASPAEAVRALITLRPGLRAMIRNAAWRVVVGRPRVRNGIAAQHLDMQLGSQPLHLVPATAPRAGGSGKDIGEIILGTVLIAVAVTTGFGGTFLLAMGISMVLSGVSGLLTQPPDAGKPQERIQPQDAPSFLFNGVTNNSQQGGPVPLVFGTHLVGSVVVNAGLNAEDIPQDYVASSSVSVGGDGIKG